MPTKIALALGGGGSRGDFQVGAVQYVYEYLHRVHNILQPDILCGTSSGSILAVKLCEGEQAGDASRGLSGLVRMWRELRVPGDMWNEEDWFRELSAAAKLDWLGWVGVVFYEILRPAGMPSILARLWSDLEQVPTAKSLYNINPVRARLEGGGLDRTRVTSSPITLLITTVALESGALRRVDKFGNVFERDGATHGYMAYAEDCEWYSEAYRQAEANWLDALVAGREEDVLQELQAAADEAKAALDACEQEHPRVFVPLVVDLVDAVVASASIPTAFPPVMLGNESYHEHYVDGGVRDMVPIEPAIMKGATRVYAICSSAAATPRWRSMADGRLITSYNTTSMLDITGRVSMDLMTNEITRSKTDPPNGWGATEVIVIEPDFDLHDIMTIDAGLIRIAMCHGYMRADDVIAAWNENPTGYRTRADAIGVQRNTAAIVMLRQRIWKKEYAAHGWAFAVDDFGRPKPASQLGHIAQAEADGALDRARDMKRDLKALLDQRVAAGGLCPPDVEQSWRQWEEHDWEPAATRPLWDKNHPFAPQRHLNVAISPASILVGAPVQVLVTATDAINGTPVDNVDVRVNDRKVGVTGTSFVHTFTGWWEDVPDGEGGSTPELVDDVIRVESDPSDPDAYYSELVTCDFVDVLLAAQCVSQTVPATLTVGQTAAVAVTVKNAGNVTWLPGTGYRLGWQFQQNNTTWGTGYVDLPEVAPTGQVTLNCNVTAPASPGQYTLQWRMLLGDSAIQWSGATPTATVNVSAVVARAAEFISQTITANALAGKVLPTTWQIIMKNTGSETWTAAAGYALGSQNPQDNTTWRKSRIPVPTSIASGQQVTFKFTGCYAPATPKTYAFQWRMLKEGVEWFGPATPVVNVVVETL